MRFSYQKMTSNEQNKIELQTFEEHLDVLRKMLFRICCLSFILALGVFFLKDYVFTLLLAPCSPNFITFDIVNKALEILGANDKIYDNSLELIATDLPSQFLAHISMSLYVGVLLASPYIIYEMFRFISPALYTNERKYSTKIILAAYSLFVFGFTTSYFLLFPISYRFLATYSVSKCVRTMVTLDSYISTFISLTMLMGVVSQLPVLSFILSKMGILDASTMGKYRKHAFIIILIMAAIITPPDVMTLFLVSFPLYILYEISILVIKISENR